MDKINEVTALSDELQASKLELDDYFIHIQQLRSHLSSLQQLMMHLSIESKKHLSAEIKEGFEQILDNVSDRLSQIDGLSQKMHRSLGSTNSALGFISSALQDNVRLLRLVPAATILRPMQRTARDLAKSLEKQIDFVIEGDDIDIDRAVLDFAKDPLNHLLRNSIDHGLEDAQTREENGKSPVGTVKIKVDSKGDQITIEVSDDGRGIDYETVRARIVERKLLPPEEAAALSEEALLDYLFHPGFSTKAIITDVSGRGVGLDVVRTNMQAAKGDISIKSVLGEGSTFILKLPLTLVSDRGMLVQVANQTFGLPTTAVKRVMEIEPAEVIEVEAGQAIIFEGKPIALRHLQDVLELNTEQIQNNYQKIPIVVVNKGLVQVALVVDQIVGEREIVIKHLLSPLISVRNVLGATLTGRGEIIVVLKPQEVVETAQQTSARSSVIQTVHAMESDEAPMAKILVVDDSITTRTLETNILKIQGYDVTACVNGYDAWQKIQSQDFDLVISDVEMPVMNGFELTQKIKDSEEFADLPVIIVTSLSSESDKQRGVDVGADAYIIKNQFETGVLIETVEQLI